MTEKDIAKKEIEGMVEWFMLEVNDNYRDIYSEVLTESEYCDTIVNAIQKQLLTWVSERQSNYSK